MYLLHFNIRFCSQYGTESVLVERIRTLALSKFHLMEGCRKVINQWIYHELLDEYISRFVVYLPYYLQFNSSACGVLPFLTSRYHCLSHVAARVPWTYEICVLIMDAFDF